MPYCKTIILSLAIATIIGSCRNFSASENASPKVITFQLVTLTLPPKFEFIKVNGVDSYSAYVISEKKDTFHLEYGKPDITFDVFQLPPKAFPTKAKEGMIKNMGELPSSELVVFSDTYEADNLQNAFDKNFYLYDTINNLKVKIIQPKKIGHGLTGIYIYNLKDGNSFSMYGENLDSATNSLGLKMFNTIKCD